MKYKIIEHNNPYNAKVSREIIKFGDNTTKREYIKYKKNFLKQFRKTKGYYPLLNYTILPTKHPTSIIVWGHLINEFNYKSLKKINVKDINEYSIYIYAVVPFHFLKEGIRVFDARNKINFKNVPNRYRHVLESPITKEEMLCTHMKKDIKLDNAILGVLQTAEHLYNEYRRFERTNEFNLEVYEHDCSISKSIK